MAGRTAQPRGGPLETNREWIVAIKAAAFVLPNFIDINPGCNSTRPIPTFFATDMYRSYLKPGANVLPVEWGFYSPSLMWQAQDGIYYNLASGYFTPTPLTHPRAQLADRGQRLPSDSHIVMNW